MWIGVRAQAKRIVRFFGKWYHSIGDFWMGIKRILLEMQLVMWQY